MKSLKILAFLILFLGVGVNSMQAQALVLKDFNWYLRTNVGLYPATDMMAVFTPSDNILHKQTFMINTNDPLVPEKGINKISFRTWVIYNGKIWQMFAEGQVFPNGKVFIVFHTNGAGNDLRPDDK